MNVLVNSTGNFKRELFAVEKSRARCNADGFQTAFSKTANTYCYNYFRNVLRAFQNSYLLLVLINFKNKLVVFPVTPKNINFSVADCVRTVTYENLSFFFFFFFFSKSSELEK